MIELVPKAESKWLKIVFSLRLNNYHMTEYINNCKAKNDHKAEQIYGTSFSVFHTEVNSEYWSQSTHVTDFYLGTLMEYKEV